MQNGNGARDRDPRREHQGFVRRVMEATGWIGDADGLIRRALTHYALTFQKRHRRPHFVVIEGTCWLCGAGDYVVCAANEKGGRFAQMCERCCAESCGAWIERKADEYSGVHRKAGS